MYEVSEITVSTVSRIAETRFGESPSIKIDAVY